MNRLTDCWDDISVHLVSTRLTVDMRKTWEIESATLSEFCTWQLLGEFVESRIQALEVIQFCQGNHTSKPKQNYTTTHPAIINNENWYICQICNKPHNIYQCNTFRVSTVGDRLLLVK